MSQKGQGPPGGGPPGGFGPPGGPRHGWPGGARSPVPFFPGHHHHLNNGSRGGSPGLPPRMSQTPPPFLVRPMVGPSSSPRPDSPQMFGAPPPRWSPSFSSPRPFFRPISPTPPPPPFFPMAPPPPEEMFSPEIFALQPSYDMEFVYPAGVDPARYLLERGTSVVSMDEETDGPTTAEIIAAQSQDYVDERLAEYQATILHLQDEQERVQKKTFVNWINSYLAKHVPPYHIVDLIEDLKDGTRLLALLEVLSGEGLPVEKGKNLRRPHFLSNCNTALQFLSNKKIKLVNINSSDVVDGRPAVVLGLVWTIILYFQIEENTKVLASLGYRFTQATPTNVEQVDSSSRPSSIKPAESPSTVLHQGRVTPSSSAEDRSKSWKHGARKALLQWVQELINKKYNLHVNDFGMSWRDGTAFLAIINSINPGLIDMQSLKQASNKTRLETAFKIAEEELEITRLLDPEDVDVVRPDEKSIMTYVAQFLSRSNEPKLRHQTDSFSIVQSIYDDLLTWLMQKTQYMEHMKQTNGLSMEYRDFINLQVEMNGKLEPYTRLKTLVESHSTVGITDTAWSQLKCLWEKLELQLKEWQWLLDAGLPDPFGRIGQWVAKAELLVSSQDVPVIMDDEAARILNAKIEDHKTFFAELPAIQADFNASLSSPLVSDIHPEQLQSLACRLESIPELAARRAVKLKFLEHKCCLVAFIVLVENRLKQWTVKYGREDHCQYLLEQYNNFVNRNKIFQEFQRAYVDMEHVIEEYKREGGIDARESRIADHFLWEIGERWKSVGMELRCVQSMLEELSAYWRRYASISPDLEEWIDRSVPMLQLPEDDRMEYFQDVNVWHEKYQMLQDTVSFLVATCDENAVLELKEHFANLSAKWNQVYQQVKQYQYTGKMIKLKKEFLHILTGLQAWLRGAENILNGPIPVEIEAARDFNQQLQQLILEIDSMDERWRLANKTFQSLVPELSGDEVDRLVKTLKKEKENLVRVRAQLPLRQNAIQQLLTQQEALEAGQGEIQDWLSQASSLLNSYSHTGPRLTQQILDKHRIFFSKKLYYKTMLDSKNKLVTSIVKSASPEQRSGQFEEVLQKMKQINDEYTRIDQASQNWDQKIQESLRCWDNFESNKQSVTEWMQTAEKLLDDTNLESKQTVETHKAYFERINERPLKEMLKATQDLGKIMSPAEYERVAAITEGVQKNWSHIMSKVPIHLTKLEFRLEEECLASILKDIDREIVSETQMLNKHVNTSTVLARHSNYFTTGDKLTDAKKCLDRLSQRKTRFMLNYPDDMSLAEQYELAKTAHDNVNERVKKLRKQLEEIPEQWNAYRAKYQEVSQWMDTVDSSLKNIMTEVQDIDAFEAEKARFLGICREVDRRRDDMKQLVQMLDILVSRGAEENCLEEQDLLEVLISRYKNLVPTIEVTMVKTETHSRCYMYREETEKIVETLVKLTDSSLKDPHPESLEEVNQMLDKYTLSLKQLEGQRPKIISLLQKGKDLEKEQNAPDFIHAQTQNLDDTWNAAFNETSDKVKNLKTTQKVWLDYQTQKNEILSLLDQAEDELSRVVGGTGSNLTEDLRLKQEINKGLREATEDTLKRLKELVQRLSMDYVPEKKFVLAKEVEDIEKRLKDMLDLLDAKVKNLQESDSKWNSVYAKIDELRKWMQGAQKLLAELISDMPPKDRVEKMNELMKQIMEKMNILQDLENEARMLDEKVVEGGQVHAAGISEQVGCLKEGMVTLYETVGVQTNEGVKALNAWTQCQNTLQEIQPRVEKAEVKVAMGFNRPSNLQEAKLAWQDAKEFVLENNSIRAAFDDALSEIEKVGNISTAQDDVDALRNKWGAVNNTAHQWNDKLETLVTNWVKYEESSQAFSNWLTEAEQSVDKDYLKPETATIQQLDDQMIKLKELSVQCSMYQSKLIPITQESDAVSQQVSAEGGTAIAGNLAKLKERHGKLAEAIRIKMMAVSDAAIEKQEIEGKVSNLLQWLDQFSNAVNQSDSVYPNQLESSLDKVHAMIEELSAHESEVLQLCDKEKGQQIPEKFKLLHGQLDDRKSALNGWLELRNWHTASNETIHHFERQLLVPGIKESELTPISTEIQNLLQKCSEFEPKAIKLEAVASKAIDVKHPTSFKPLLATSMVTETRDRLKALDLKIKSIVDNRQKLSSKANEIKELQNNLRAYIVQAQEKVASMKPTDCTLPSIQKMQDDLSGLLCEHLKKEELKTNLHKLSKQIMEGEPLINLQEVVQSIDMEWGKVQDLLTEKMAHCSDAADLIESYNESKGKIEKALTDIQVGAQPVLATVPHDSGSAMAILGQLKKYDGLLTSKKPLLDACCNDGKQLLSKFAFISPHLVDGSGGETVSQELGALTLKYDKLKEQLSKASPKIETHAVLWKSIEASRGALVSWLDGTKASLEEAKGLRDSNAVRARIDTYKDDLGEKYNLKMSVEAKLRQLAKLGQEDGSETPTTPTPLDEQSQDFDNKFKDLETMCKELESSLEIFQDQERAIKAKLKNCSDQVSKLKQVIGKCEDRSGSVGDLLGRLEILQKANKECQALKPSVDSLEKQVKEFKTANPGWDEAHVQNLVRSVKKWVSICSVQVEAVKSSLVSVLEKNYWDLFHAAGRIINGLVEKVKLLEPKTISDCYTLQGRLSSIGEIEDGVKEAKESLPTVEEALKALKGVEGYAGIDACVGEYSKLINDLMFVETNLAQVKGKVAEINDKWSQFDKLNGQLSEGVKEIETKVRSEVNAPVDVASVGDKIRQVDTLSQSVDKLKGDVGKLSKFNDEILKLAPDFNNGQAVTNLQNRIQGLTKSIGSQKDRLVELKKNNELYRAALVRANDWIAESEKKLNDIQTSIEGKGGRKASLSDSGALEQVKSLIDSKEGQDLMNKVLELGQAMIPGTTGQCKDLVRSEVKQLRDKWEGFFDKGNSMLKKLEGVQLALKSFEDSINEVRNYVQGAKEKVGQVSVSELQRDLPEKKSSLHASKLMLNDVIGHEEIIKGLKDRMKDFGDAVKTLDEFSEDCKNIEVELKKGIEAKEKIVADHEKLNEMLDSLRDYVKKVANEASALGSEQLGAEELEVRLDGVQKTLEDYKKVGNDKMDACRKQMENLVKNTTHVDGHPELNKALDGASDLWKVAIVNFEDTVKGLAAMQVKTADFHNRVDQLNTWVKAKEAQAKDSSFKSTVDAKVAHLKRLEGLLLEIKGKEKEFVELTEEEVKAPPCAGNVELEARVAELNSRYQGLGPVVQDAINRCSGYVKDHKKFNDNHADLMAWISEMQKSCKDISEVVGDANELQDRKSTLSALIEAKTRKSTELEAVLEAGEHLYASTSPDGREIIRQQIKIARDGWDNLGDNLQSTIQRVDTCLNQFNDFTLSQEELTKWLRGIEVAMQVHTQLKGTLQEKNAQLHNHKIVNQEITSHQVLVESLCDKAQQLVDVTNDQSLQGYIKSIKILFQSIKEKSKDLLGKLEKCIADHSKLNEVLKEGKEIYGRIGEALILLDDESGEKSDVARRLEEVKILKEDLVSKKSILDKIHERFDVVQQTTSDVGIQALQADIQGVQDAFDSSMSTADGLLEKLSGLLKAWQDFESGLQANAQLFRKQETFFRSQDLQATLQDKENTLKILTAEWKKVTEYESEFATFLENSHALLRTSNAEKIKPLLMQINNRYQLLHVLTKEVVNRWQGIVDDHKGFDEKFTEALASLNSLENNFKPLENEMDLQARSDGIKNLGLEKQQVGQKINLLFPLAEKIYPDTAATGREKVRQELRNLRDRFEVIDAAMNNLVKKSANESMQLTNYQENLQQALQWLDSMEKNASVEVPNWMSVPDIRSKIIKAKANLQDIMSYRRVIESVQEKANELVARSPGQNLAEITEGADNVKRRYEALVNNLLVDITGVEETMDYVQQWHDAQKRTTDWIKNTWDVLAPLTDRSGAKSALNDRLKKVDELKASLGEGSANLDALELLLKKETKATPSKVKEYFKKDLLNLRFDFDKLASGLEEAYHNLQEQLHHWSEFEDRFERLNLWLEEAEATLKSYALCNTLEEKDEQREKYQDLIQIVDSRSKEIDDFVHRVDNVQKLIKNLKENEPEFEKFSNRIADLIQSTGETRLPANIQQIVSRFESIQQTAKEILKKCESAVADHKAHRAKVTQFGETLAELKDKSEKYKVIPVNIADLEEKLSQISDEISMRPSVTTALNSLSESGEKLYPATGSEGKEAIRSEIQELTDSVESLFDALSCTEIEMRTQLNKWTGFEESKDKLLAWFKDMDDVLSKDLELKMTLDEKRAQLTRYRNILHEIMGSQQIVLELHDKAAYLPEGSEGAFKLSESLKAQHQKLLEKSQSYVEQYEAIVCNHQQYMKAVQDTTEYMDATQTTVATWSDENEERTVLQAHLERLKNLKLSLPEEAYRVEEIRTLGNNVIPGTLEGIGQENIRSQIDTSQQDWESLVSSIESSINSLQQKLALWTAFECEKDKFMQFLKETDAKLFKVDLQPTLVGKITQLGALQEIQAEVRSRELEVDSISDRALNIQRQGVPLKSSSASVSELTLKYQQISTRTKELVQKWQDYVNAHQEFDVQIQECSTWLEDIRDKLSCCADFNVSLQKDLEGKLANVHDLLLCKDEGFTRVHKVFEAAQSILGSTAPSGHEPINDKLKQLQEEWSSLTARMIDTKNQLDENMHRWAGFLEQIHQLNKTIEYVETLLTENAPFQATVQEKRSQLETIKNLEEKLEGEKLDVESLKAKAQEMMFSGQQSQAASQALEILKKFDTLSQLIRTLREEREGQYKDHRNYKEAHEELVGWLHRAREKIPILTQSGRLFDVENASATLNNLANKRTQGDLLVERLHQAGQVVMASTSTPGKSTITAEIKELNANFINLFGEIVERKDSLETTMALLRDWKEEYERLSDWLQQCDIIVKAAKNTYVGSIEEKRKQVADMQEVLDKLLNGKVQMDKFNKAAEPLMKSHLDSHVGNLLRQINSRYEAQVKMGTDVLNKVRANLENHEEFGKSFKKASDWIEEAKYIIGECSQSSNDQRKERLQANLAKIQDLVQRQEEGQRFVHATINWGDKALRSTRSDGREVINDQMKEIQNEWERLVKKMASTKVSLETNLLQWADYNSSYSQVQKWISDREQKLQKVAEHKVSRGKKGQPIPGMSSVSIGDRKANLRATNTIVQDIVSLEPMIESVTSKAENLKQEAPASEISTKYQSLTKQAKEIYERQKIMVEQHQAFADLANDLMAWIRQARERLVKISEPVGDKETLSTKITQLKVLQSELPDGQKKLDLALAKGKDACGVVDEDDKELIEEEVAVLQEEFDTYSEALTKTQQQLELGLVRWKEWEDQYGEAEEWLNESEKQVKSFHQPQNSLDEKKTALEAFQVKLQSIFDWQKELDKLNLLAQMLLETCADSRVSNAVTQMTSRFNALLSLAKEVIRKLELQYQEHQQHNALYHECEDWISRSREKLAQQSEVSYNLADVNNRLQSVKGMKQTIEQGQNKLRYVLELKEKIMLTSDSEGAAKINEDTEILKQDFDKLVADLQEARQRLASRAAVLEEIEKLHKLILDWLDEIQGVTTANGSNEYADVSEKRAYLEKLKGLEKEVNVQAEMLSKLETKIGEVDGMPKDPYEPTFSRYEQLKQKLAENTKHLEDIVADHENYKRVYNEALEAIRKIRGDLQKFSDSQGEKDALLQKIAAMESMSGPLENGDKLVKKTKECGQKANETCSDKDLINQELHQLQLEWDSIQTFFKDCHKKLKKGISAWEEFEKVYGNAKSDINDLNKRLSSEPENENATPEDLERCKKLLGDITTHKYSMEDLNEKCEQLIEECATPRVRDDTIQLQTQYTLLVANSQALLSRTQKKLADHTEFLKGKKEIEDWLNRAQGTVQDCSGFDTQAIMIENYETIQSVATRLTEGNHLLSLLQDAFTRIVNAVPVEQQDSMRDDVNVLRARWEDLNVDIKSSLSKLKEILQRLTDFDEKCNQLGIWCTNMLESINSDTDDKKSELGAIKTSNERYKSLQNEIESEKAQLDKLDEESKELTSLTKEERPVKTVQELQQKWNEINELVKKRRAALEEEISNVMEYHGMLQEIEKWLLQISFQLMAHNSLYITNRDQTVQELDVHEALLQEIVDYQNVLNGVKAKGQEQIDRYVESNPEIKTTVQKQLKNVQESYDSLLHTGNQIRNRLLESLNKFQEYEDTLESIMKNLDEWSPVIDDLVQAPVTNIEDSARKLEEIRKTHNRLQGEKNRLSLAVHACEAATASLSRPASPQETLLQPIPDKELAVRCRLEDLIDQVQTHMASLSAATLALEEIKANKDALNQWVEDAVGTLKEIKNRPSKFRPDTSQHELNQLQDIRNLAGEKLVTLDEIEIQESDLVEVKYLPELRSKLENLDAEVQKVVESRLQIHDKVGEHKNLVASVQSWLDGLSAQLEKLEKGSGLDCDEKLEKVGGINQEFKRNAGKLDQVKNSGAEIMKDISNVDAQMVEEQLKMTERRFGEVEKRISRKIQILENVKKSLDEFFKDLSGIDEYLQEKNVDATYQMGYEIQPIENALGSVKGTLRELDSKEIVLSTLDRRLSTLQPELEEKEIKAAEGKLAATCNEMERLKNDLKNQLTALKEGIQIRRRFHDSIDSANAWVNRISKELILGTTTPLASSKVQLRLSGVDKLIGQIKDYIEISSSEYQKDFGRLRKECNDEEGGKLEVLINSIQQSFVDLNSNALLHRDTLNRVLSQRKGFEEEFNKCENWLQEAETSLGSDVKGSSNLPVLEEQLKKYKKLESECEVIKLSIKSLNEEGKLMMPSLNEPDRQILTDQLASLQTKVYSLSSNTAEKIAKLGNAMKELQEASNIVAESRAYLNKVKAEVDSLNRPMGNNFDETQKVLSSFETLLDGLKTYRKKLDADEYQSYRVSSEFRDIMKDQDNMIYFIEGLITRLRHLLLLQQQFSALVTEVQNFLAKYDDVVEDIRKSGGSNEDKVKRYDDVLSRIQYCEAQLASAVDKGERISEEGTVADRNAITEQLQTLKQGLSELRRTVESKRSEDELAVAENLKFGEELDAAIDWLHEKETIIKSRPLLEKSVTSVEAEIRKHELLAQEVNDKLLSIASIEEALSPEGISSALTDKLSETRLLSKTLPQELADRYAYLDKNKSLREHQGKLVSSLMKWVTESQDRLKKRENGINFEHAAADLSEHKTFFSNEKAILQQLQNIKQGVDNIWPSLATAEQENISKEHQNLNELVQNTFNNAKSKEAELEQAKLNWKTYLELVSIVDGVIAKAELPEEAAITLGALRHNLVSTQEALANLQNQQIEFDNLRERADSIEKQADKHSKGKIKGQMQAIESRWNGALGHLDKRKDEINTLVNQWEQCEMYWQKFESGLTAIEEHFGQIDPAIRSHQQLNDTRASLQKILGECNELASTHKDLLHYSQFILTHLSTASDIFHSSLKGKLNHLSEQYKAIMDLVQEKLRWLNSQGSYLSEVDQSILDYRQRVEEIAQQLDAVCPYDPDHNTTDSKIQGVDEQIRNVEKSILDFNSQLKDRFTALKQLLPSALADNISGLELEVEKLQAAMNDKRKVVKRFQTIRSEYDNTVKGVKSWILDTEKKLETESGEPQVLKQNVQALMAELPKILDQMEHVEKYGKLIMENTPSTEEKQTVRNEIENLCAQLSDIKKTIEERNFKIGESLDSWQRFLQLYAQVMQWGDEKKLFLKEPLQLSSLPDTRLKLNNYAMAVKSLKVAGKQLSEMGRELDRIAEISNVGPLHAKLDEVEQMKIQVETELLERNALLQETTEEWEQCEKKFRETQIWLEKTKQSIEQQSSKRKPLRDQLASKEKLLADVCVQKTKISLALEKLQVHFNSKTHGIEGDPNVAYEEAQLQTQLDHISEDIKNQCTALESAVAQIDKLQEEVQLLRTQLGSAEQKLRHVCSPSYLSQDREKAAMEQTAWKEKLRMIQSKITARNERIKLLMVLGTPSSAQPLHS